VTQLADGDWHRLHPATPLLKGGIAFIAILGVVIANLRERLIEVFVPGLECPEEFCTDDPISIILDRYLILALLATVGVLVLIIALFWLSWRMHTFRITDEVVEVRSGVIFRSHRKARLDRVQGINVSRPLFARIFGAAKLELSTAGSDANVELSYLTGANADGLRAEILRRASGIRAGAAAAAVETLPGEGQGEGGADALPADAARAGLGDVARQRFAEFTAPELDPDLAPPQSVVTMSAGRLIGSTLLSTTMIFFVITIAVMVIIMTTTDAGSWVFFALIPTVFGFGSYLVNRVLKSLRYSIASTPDGVRVGYGLLSTTNDTLPPGRIHAVQVTQDLLWRPADWWMVSINLASHSATQGSSAAQQKTTILPVGSRADVLKVLELVLPELVTDETRLLIEGGLTRSLPEDGYTTTPRRAAVLRWFSWRRNGFLLHPDAVILRKGAIWRTLTVVPTARTQSVAAHQGPLERLLGVAHVRVHTVAGPVTAEIGAIDVTDASALFRDTASAGVAAIGADRSHRWGAG